MTVYFTTGQSSSGLDGYGGYTWGVTTTGGSSSSNENSLYDCPAVSDPPTEKPVPPPGTGRRYFPEYAQLSIVKT